MLIGPPPPGSSSTPLPSGPQRRLILFTLVLFLLAIGSSILRFPHPYSDDDANHFLIAKDAFRLPRLFLQIWGRPGFTLIHALPAQLGFLGSRLCSVLLSLGTALLVGEILKKRGRRAQAFGIAFCLFQTYFFQLADGALTETVYAFALALGLLLLERKRWFLAALAFAYTCTCRFEGAAFLPFAYLVMVREILPARGVPLGTRLRRLLVLGLSLGSLPLLWNFLCAWDTGFEHLLPLVSQNVFVTDPQATYGHGKWYEFSLAAPEIHGALILACALFGLVVLLRERRGFYPSFFLAFYALQSALWAGGHFRTGGYNRFFASLAPVAAVMAAVGAQALFVFMEQRWNRSRLQIAAGALIVACAASALLYSNDVDGRTHEQYEAMLPAVEMIKKAGGISEEQPLLSESIYPMLLLDCSKWRSGPELIPYGVAGLDRAPKGAFVIYCSYRPRPFDRIPIMSFFADSEEERLRDRIQGELTWLQELERTKPRFELLYQRSLIGRSWGYDADHDPWPYHVKLFRVLEDGPVARDEPIPGARYLWAR